MHTKRLKNAEDAKDLRKKTLQAQGGKDPIIGIAITSAVLDHQHFAPYKCRRVLQSEVNAFEGKVYNAYRRYMRHLTDMPLSKILVSLALYLEQDYSANPKHHTAVHDELRPFKRLNAQKQISILKGLGLEPSINASKRIKQIRKLLLTDQLSYEQLLKLTA